MCYVHADVDECAMGDLSDCADQGAMCTNIPGSHLCTCLSGYTGNGTHCEGKACMYAGILS